MSIELKNITKNTEISISGLLKNESVVSLSPGDSKQFKIADLNENYVSTLDLFKGALTFGTPVKEKPQVVTKLAPAKVDAPKLEVKSDLTEDKKSSSK